MTETILVMDSALNGCNVGLYTPETGQLISERSLVMERGQSEALIPAVQDCVREASISFQDIDSIAVTIGPGGFTGVRAGIAAAKAFSLALGMPMCGVSTLDVIAYTYLQEKRVPLEQLVFVLLETKRGEYFVQSFDAELKTHMEPRSIGGSEICGLLPQSDFVLLGDAVERFVGEFQIDKSQADFEYTRINPFFLAKLASLRNVWVDEIEPLYLRGADVSQSKKVYRILEKSDS